MKNIKTIKEEALSIETKIPKLVENIEHEIGHSLPTSVNFLDIVVSERFAEKITSISHEAGYNVYEQCVAFSPELNCTMKKIRIQW